MPSYATLLSGTRVTNEAHSREEAWRKAHAVYTARNTCGGTSISRSHRCAGVTASRAHDHDPPGFYGARI